MDLTKEQFAVLANKHRKAIQADTPTVGIGTTLAFALVYGFCLDMAKRNGGDPREIAREQLEAFLDHPVAGISLTKEH